MALGGVLLLGVVICLAADRTNTLLPQTVRPVPGWMAGPLRPLGFRLRAGELITAIALMFGCYVVTVLRAREISARTMVTAIVALNVLVMIAPPLFSTDTFSYQAYARMFAEYAINPYNHGPYTIALDPVYHYIGAKWYATPSVYGPLFTLLSAAIAHASLATSELVFKLVAMLSSLGTCWLIWRSAEIRSVDPVRGVALFGLNPLVVIYGVGGGHNDLLMLLATTAGVYAILSRRDASGGVLIACGAAIKLTGALLAPFAFVADAPPQPARRRRALLIGFLLTAAVMVAAGLHWFGTGLLHMPGTLESVQNENPWGSLPGVLSALVGGSASHLVGVACGGLTVLLCLRLLYVVWRGRMDWIEAAAWVTAAMLITASSVLPWYGSWLLPLVALCEDRRLWATALGLSCVLGFLTIAGYVPGGAFFGL